MWNIACRTWSECFATINDNKQLPQKGQNDFPLQLNVTTGSRTLLTSKILSL